MNIMQLSVVCFLVKGAADYAESIAARDLTPVITAYQHALFGRYPQSRYVIGTDGWGFVITAAQPTWYQDWLIRALGFPPKPKRSNRKRVSMLRRTFRRLASFLQKIKRS